MHELYAPVSRRHLKVVPGSFEENSKEAEVLLVKAAGPEVITVCGGVVSTFQRWTAGEESTLPARSPASTSNVCSPSARPASSRGEAQGSSSPPSRRQRKVAAESGDEKAIVALERRVAADGPEVIVVSGAVASCVHSHRAGEASTLPARSTARTARLCSPSVSPASSCGKPQGSNEPPSRLHSKRASVSSAEKAKEVERSTESAPGPRSILV